MSVKGKNIIVTGSSRGIGKEIASTLAKKGANLIICSTKEEQAAAVASELSTAHGITAHGIAVDISNEDSVKALIEKTLETLGSIDVLINNAGITKDNLLMRMSSEDWDAVLNTNLKSIYLTTKAAIRPMMKNKGGRIINMSSVVGVIGNAGQANYAASKAGIIGFSKSIAKEYASKNVICNVVAPGFIETDMTATLPKDYLDNIMGTVPLGRLGTATEVADLVSFLSSDEAGYMTGQVFQIDGGISM